MRLYHRVLFHLIALRYDRRTVTSLEYGIIAAAVVVVGLSGFSVVGARVATKMTNVKAALT